MLVVFRTDASLQIGSGHVMRCLALADALRDEGAHCHFICREHAGHLATRIESKGHRVALLPVAERARAPMIAPPHAAWLGCDWRDDAKQTIAALGDRQPEWFVVDHYALDAQWENAIRPHCEKLLVIDDLADRTHHCDLLLDQNLGRVPADYASLMATGARFLIGPRYALLRPEFAALREYSLARRRETLRQILVSMGGVDQLNATWRILESLRGCILPHECRVVVILGEHAPWVDDIRAIAATTPFECEVLVNVPNVAKLMAGSDLSIGAAGGMAWERCCLGLPSISVVLADNQRDGAFALAAEGATLVIPESGKIDTDLCGLLTRMQQDNALMTSSLAASAVTEGNGAWITARILLGTEHDGS